MNNPIIIRENKEEIFKREECEEILKNVLKQEQRNGKLLDYKVETDIGSVGFLGEYFHLDLSYQLDDCDDKVQERRLFVKSIPFHNADMSVFIEKSGMMLKEITLYGSLLNELQSYSKNIWCAHCYLTRKDLFVMQNITDLGYGNLESTDGFLDEAHMLPLLKGLATMHASSIAYERKHNVCIGDQLKDVLIEVTVHPSVVWYTAGLRAILAVALEHPKYQSAEMQEFIREKLPERLETVYEMVNPSKKHRNVFCHRDIWGGNIFYHRTEPFSTNCVFVDFQLSRYSPPALDILLALYLNVKPSVRRQIMRRCVDFYYEYFAKQLETMCGIDAAEELSRAQFEASLIDFELFGASYNCLASTILRVPDNFLKNLKDNHPVDFHRYTNVDRTKDVLELMRTNVEFGSLMHECIEDMMEVVLK